MQRDETGVEKWVANQRFCCAESPSSPYDFSMRVKAWQAGPILGSATIAITMTMTGVTGDPVDKDGE